MANGVHRRLDDDVRDRVSAYVFGGLSEHEIEHFEEHLARCTACREELKRTKPLVDELILSVPDCDPPPSLRDRALALFRKQRNSLHAASTRGWIATDVTDVEFLPLWRDPERRRRTVLIRMGPGTALPAHRHLGPEECTVIDGELYEGRVELRTGDTLVKETGSEHSVFTRGGCLLLVTMSQVAELS